MSRAERRAAIAAKQMEDELAAKEAIAARWGFNPSDIIGCPACVLNGDHDQDGTMENHEYFFAKRICGTTNRVDVSCDMSRSWNRTSDQQSIVGYEAGG